MMNEAQKLSKIADEAAAKARELEKRFDAVEHSATIKQLEADKRELQSKLEAEEKSSDEWLKLYQDIKGSLRYWKHEYDSLKADTDVRIAVLKAGLTVAHKAMMQQAGLSDALVMKVVMAYNEELVIGEVEMSPAEMREYMAETIHIPITGA